MNILMIANARSVHTQRWARALSEREHTVMVISIRNAHIPNVTVLPRAIGYPDKSKFFALLSYVYLLIRLPFDMRRIKPDVVNPHYCITNGTIAALAGARPRVVNVWGSDLVWGNNAPQAWWRRALIRYSLSQADGIVSTSHFMAGIIKELLPSHPPVTIVPFGVDTEHFKPAVFKADKPIIRVGFVKSFSRKYSPETFVEAAALVAELRTDVEFVMAGRGPMLEDMKHLCCQRGLNGKIQFPGFVPHHDVAALMQDLDILVNCSRSESFGTVICEASSSMIPVVATDVGGVRETVKNEETGILVPHDNAEALADAILKLVTDSVLRKRMGENGREFIKGHYEWSGCVTVMEQVLEASSRTSHSSPHIRSCNPC